jgi:tetratricopeptide (TPR) repeat protein
MSPSSAHGYAHAADTYFAYDMPIKARRFYETAIEKGDRRPVVWYGLARVLDRKNEHEKAEQAWRNAIEGDPLNGLYYAGLASAIKSRTRDPKSLEAARLNALALEVDPENLELFSRLWLDDEIRKSLEGLNPESKPAK